MFFDEHQGIYLPKIALHNPWSPDLLNPVPDFDIWVYGSVELLKFYFKKDLYLCHLNLLLLSLGFLWLAVSNLALQFGVNPASVVLEMVSDERDSALVQCLALVICLMFFLIDELVLQLLSLLPLLGRFLYFPAFFLQFEENAAVHLVHQFLSASCLSWDVEPPGVKLPQARLFAAADKLSLWL